MHFKKLYLIVISSMALLSCNGGNSNQSPAPMPSPAPSPTPTTINTYSYIITSNGAAETMQMNFNGTFNTASRTGGGILFDLPTAIAFNNEYAYIVNSANSGSYLINSVSQCSTNGYAHSLGSCKTVANGFNWPYGLAFYNDYAYVTNINSSYTSLNSGYVSKCKVNKLNESLEECSTTAIGYSFPRNITFYNNNAYIANSDNSLSYPNTAISKCQVDESGDLNQCSNILTAINQLSGVAINNSYFYFTSIVNNSTYEGKVTACRIESDGSLSTCESAADNLYAPINIAFDNGHAYIITTKSNLYPSIYVCGVNPNGTLSNCSGFLSSDQYQAIAFKKIIKS